MTVVKLLGEEVIRIADFVIDDLSVFLDRHDVRIDESSVWLQAECLISLLHLPVELWVDIDTIAKHESLSSLIISL